jgi:predicted  nucleic acid-binding Zn-ribbon protein
MFTSWLDILSVFLNIALGSGLIVSIVTLKSTKQKANADVDQAIATVKTTELQNVESAIKIWRDMANELNEKYELVLKEVDCLRKELNRLNVAVNKTIKMLDKITPENLESMVETIKQEIQK